MSTKDCTSDPRHADFMKAAIFEALLAGQKGEVPVGAVLVSGCGEIVSRGHNQVISRADPSAHAEVVAIRRAARKIENYRLAGTSLYVTIEPCPMCMGLIVHARIELLVFGAMDPKWGAAGSLFDFSNDPRLNHRVKVLPGVMESESREIIQDFFRKKRSRNCPTT